MKIEFTVCGDPKPQPRPRAFSRKFGDTHQARVYDPGTAEGWKSAVAVAAKPFLPVTPLVGPVSVDITFYFQRPKSHQNTESKRAKGYPLLKHGAPLWHCQRPDRDNLEKAVLDALKVLGVFEDDGQVCTGKVAKQWAAAYRPAGAVITITQLNL